MTSSSSTRLPAWRALEAHRPHVATANLRELFAGDPDRFRRFSLQTCDLLLDYSKNRISEETLALLLELAGQAGVEAWRDKMYAGEPINTSEGRAALHVALRHPADRPFPSPQHNVMPSVMEVRAAMRRLSQALVEGRWTGASGKPIGAVVHIGIGGSHLGPAMATRALAARRIGPPVHFVSNLDSAHLVGTLESLNPETTLFIIASKSFGTPECLANAASARAWLLEGRGSGDDAVARHFVAVTAEPERAVAFGIPRDNVLELWDWVGGRYSLWSAVGLPVAFSVGMDAFEELLAGAHEMDRHFREAPLEQNMPVVLGLLGIWYRNFLGAANRAVLPYDYALRDLPAHLQQLEMESTGKRVGRDGEPLGHVTCPVVWGAPGNDAQHAFYQLLHQGTELVPCDFIVAASSQKPLPGHEDGVLANALAQSEALMVGQDANRVREQLTARGLGGAALEAAIPHRLLPGNQPSNTLMYERLTPRRLGTLIALYEHRTFVQSVCWEVNAFDQWGVELGKVLAERLLGELADGADTGEHDASTAGLLAHARRLKGLE